MTALNITPGTLDIKAAQGKTWTMVITVRDGLGNLKDLTGYAARWQVRATAGASKPVLSLSSEEAGITLSSAGLMTITATAAQTRTIPASNYVHEIELTEPGGAIPPFLAGKLTVTAEVVR